MIQLKPVCTTYLFMQPVLDEKDTNKAGERLASATGLLLRDSLHYLNILMFCELSIGKDTTMVTFDPFHIIYPKKWSLVLRSK